LFTHASANVVNNEDFVSSATGTEKTFVTSVASTFSGVPTFGDGTAENLGIAYAPSTN